jgi:hypothetical protein
MGKVWAAAVGWWQGKKTMVGGGLVMAAAVAGVWYGKLDPVSGMTLLGIGLSIAGFSAKANRHQAELLTALQGVAKVGADTQAGNRTAALQDAEGTATQLAPAAIAMVPGLAVPEPAAVHLSAAGLTDLVTAAIAQFQQGSAEGVAK